jgi:hypothetical protein
MQASGNDPGHYKAYSTRRRVPEKKHGEGETGGYGGSRRMVPAGIPQS